MKAELSGKKKIQEAIEITPLCPLTLRGRREVIDYMRSRSLEGKHFDVEAIKHA